jgi:glycosyltransferase involved in cell wall biosynthesis
MTTSMDGSKSGIEAAVCQQEIAILVPCSNEELTVGKTVAAFREVLPLATIYVYDNNSTDRTVEVARAAGAVFDLVRNERPLQFFGLVGIAFILVAVALAVPFRCLRPISKRGWCRGCRRPSSAWG